MQLIKITTNTSVLKGIGPQYSIPFCDIMEKSHTEAKK